MAKRRTSPQAKPLTRKQLSRLERERAMQRRVVMGVGALLVLVVLTLIGGFVYERTIKVRQPIAQVGDRVITVGEYQKRVNFERYLVYRNMQRIANQLRALPNDESSGFLRQVYAQRLQQLTQEYQGIPGSVFETVLENAIIEAKAAELGITVTDEEIQARIEQRIAGELGAITQDDLNATATAVVQATATAAAWTPTPTAEVTSTEALTVTGAITPTATPFPTPTPNVLTTAKFEEAYQAFLKELQDRLGLTEAEYRAFVRVEILREKAQQYFADQVPTEEEQVYIKAVLLPSEEEARALLDEIQAGKSFEEAAAAYAREHAGDLGWFGRGQMVPAFEEAAFNLQPGEISDPVETEFGWHIIQVTDRDEENERVRARHILVETEEEAKAVKQRLEAGEDFADLARELSKDTTSIEESGIIDVGWIVKDQPGIPPEVAEAAFQLKPGEQSDPIKLDDTAFVIIKLDKGPEVRPLDPQILAQRREDAFREWLQEQKASMNVQRFWDFSKVPDDPFADRIRDLLRFAG